MKSNNQWISLFFKCVGQISGRTYECLHCKSKISVYNAEDLSEKAQHHLNGNCHKTTEGNE
jgi:hypothetical protein